MPQDANDSAYRLSLVLCRNADSDCDYSSAYVVNQAGGMVLQYWEQALPIRMGIACMALDSLSAPGTFFTQIHILASSDLLF